jgi:predicted Zn-dependent protease with MMP-like domain
MAEEPEVAWIEEVHDLAEAGYLEEALAEASRHCEATDPTYLRLQGWLRLERWDLEGARASFEAIPPEWLEPFDLEKLSIVEDLEERPDRADALLREANRIDPETSPLPPRLTPDQFEELVREASNELPENFRAALDEVAVVIDPMPTREILDAPASGIGPDLLGLFAGFPLHDREAGGFGELPPRIFLFQRNLERACWNREDLGEQIRITLFHELGHALGFEEDELEEIGLG